MVTYREAGVDIDAGEELIRRIAPLAKATRTPHVVGGLGGFAGLCGLPTGLVEPLLVSGTDGVGTKLKIAFTTGIHDTVGIDLVAMCVNDIITVGAEPLFFLDYFATGKLEVDVGEAVVVGIAEGCRQAGCALLGGETAELPGMYAAGEYDLAGFAVGVVDRPKLLEPHKVKLGDRLVAVASSGLHSNGYSLARRVLLEVAGLGFDDAPEALGGATVGEALLTPTRIYARAVKALLARATDAVHAICHVTGGGIVGNLPRVLGEGLGARVALDSYTRPPIFELIAERGPVDEAEMHRTFNLGVGLVIAVADSATDDVIAACTEAGERAWLFGEVIAGEGVVFT